MKKIILAIILAVGFVALSARNFSDAPPHATGWTAPPSEIERQFFYGQDDSDFYTPFKDAAPELFQQENNQEISE